MIVIAVGIAGIDLLAKSALIFGFGVEVFVEEPGLHSRGYFWTKWGYWATRAFIAALVYGVLTALPKTRYRDWMPARPSFYGYTGTLFVLYAVETVCALCVGGGVSRWAYCVFGLCYLTEQYCLGEALPLAWHKLDAHFDLFERCDSTLYFCLVALCRCDCCVKKHCVKSRALSSF